jgi:hypothetical protein
LLRYRVCARLRLSVEEFHALPDVDQANFTALALLDGWGVEWQRVAQEVRNASLRMCRAQGVEVRDEAFATEADMEAFKHLNPPEETAAPETDWQAVEAAMCTHLGIKR